MPDTQHTGVSLRKPGPVPASRGRHVLVIGASASGLSVASHLLRREARVQVTVIETQGSRCRRLRRAEFAPLLAEETGPLPLAPLHLVEALRQHAGRLHVAETTCLSVASTPQGVAARTADGTTYLGRAAVLAFALQPPASGVPPRERNAAIRALRLDPADLPLGTGAAALVRALRARVKEAADRGVGTAAALAAFRLSDPALWHDLPDEARERLLRHGGPMTRRPARRRARRGPRDRDCAERWLQRP